MTRFLYEYRTVTEDEKGRVEDLVESALGSLTGLDGVRVFVKQAPPNWAECYVTLLPAFGPPVSFYGEGGTAERAVERAMERAREARLGHHHVPTGRGRPRKSRRLRPRAA